MMTMASTTTDLLKKSAVRQSSNGGMRMILSPAKTLDLAPYDAEEQDDGVPTPTRPSCDVARTRRIATAMQQRTTPALAKLLKLSPTLADTAGEYWSKFSLDPTTSATPEKPAVFAFSGAAYQGLRAHDLLSQGSHGAAALSYLQANLRILDPLYGVLRPLDAIQPYRLEMACRGVLPEEERGTLSASWKASVTRFLNKNDDNDDDAPRTLLNLASDEYAAAVDGDALAASLVKVVFQQEGKVIAVHAKKARGMMVRFLAEGHVTTLAGVREFREEGYAFVAARSSQHTLVFDRKKQQAVAAPGKKKREPTKNKAAGTKKVASKKATTTKKKAAVKKDDAPRPPMKRPRRGT